MTFDLASIWAAIIAFSVLTYVVLDGFDLGVGILFPAFPDRADRDVITNSIAPVWDGNETWLVLGGGGLMAVFPLAYATVLPALYFPIILMLLGLVFRGVAFEFRWRASPQSRIWDRGFWLGSTVAAFMQGIALGALVQGITIEDRSYAGGWWDWLTPFSIVTGVGVVIGYAALGATWLNMKTNGPIQIRSQSLARVFVILLLIAIVVVSLWTPFVNQQYVNRWFKWPAAFFFALSPLLLLLGAYTFWWALKRGNDQLPFMATLGFFVLTYVGLGISFYPDIVPGSLSIQDAAAPNSSLRFLLWGAAICVPMILGYTGYAYWVFRGKVDPNEGYH